MKNIMVEMIQEDRFLNWLWDGISGVYYLGIFLFTKKFWR